MKAGLESNIWKYGLHLITNKRTYITILGVYLLTVPGTTTQTIGTMLLLGNLAGFVFEIPSGYISDKLGHKNALVIGKLCLVLSTLSFLIGGSVPFFIIGNILLGIGMAFESGTGTAFMHETITTLGRQNEYSKIMGRLRSIGFAVPIALIMAVPFLVEISYKVPFMVALVIDMVGLAAVMSLVVPEKTNEQIQEIDLGNFNKVVAEGWRLGYFKFAAFSALIAGTITASSGFKDVYQAAMGVPVIYFGIFWGTSRLIVSTLLLFNDRIKNSLTHLQFLFIKMVSAILLISVLAISSSAWLTVAAFILIAAFNWSFTEVGHDYVLQIIKGSQFKATLLSIGAELTTLINAIGAFVIGYLAARNSYQTTFSYIAVGFGVLSLLAYIVIYLASKQINKQTKWEN